MLNFEQPYPPLLVHSETLSSFIVVIILGTFAVVTVLARLCRAYVVYKKLLLEDYAIILAIRQAFSILYAIFIALVVLSGPGLAADDLASEELRNFSRNYYVSNIFLCISLACAKSSAILCSTTKFVQPKPCYAILAMVALWTLITECIITLQCHPNHYTLGPTADDMCVNQYAAQYFTKVSDMVTDVAIALLPAVLVSKVQMPMSKRLRVGLIYATRLVTVVFTAMSLNSLSGYYHADITKRPAQAVSSSTWASIALWVSIMTACLPHILNPSLVAAVSVLGPSAAELYELQNSSNRVAKQQTRQEPVVCKSELAMGETPQRSLSLQRDEDGMGIYEYTDEDEGSEKGLTNWGIMRTRCYVVDHGSNEVLP
ncbi:hypothetical protein LTR49_028206 [Elasticomyces elasticus]|nr:hypothetical protein LTR49_028206 [Elasticomyces elasticus]